MKNERIYLSPPNTGKEEVDGLSGIMDTGWVAPVGPAIDAFETQLSSYVDGEVLALNSGTSALHLALILCGVKDGDHVIVGNHTFAACANVVLYERAIPIFIDSENTTGNIDPDLLVEYLQSTDQIPKAIIVTHIYGMPAQIERVCEVAKKYGVIVIEDAAEALGSTVNGKPVGSFGDFGVVSFNGNKIITTSSGGALICTPEMKKRGLHLATQANVGDHRYDHKEAGYNYRMSNVLAGIGIAQFSKLDEFIRRKREIFDTYKEALSEYISFTDEPKGIFSNRWLTAGLIRENIEVMDLIYRLEKENIESRRFWKPLHLHSAFSEAPYVGGRLCEDMYEKGICLPSGTGLSYQQQELVIEKIKQFFDQ
ncbi:dTDP-4-amino-4,6-dideoxygalactose transaminase [Ekhidna lutea]|uniref:dTDP-4-amino-4,6-dideoxygalactose transaminase n=1 Tax=Ekhidna lutea TaxID=447679 RepID=A0A239HQI6_EKHLU|nr:aminotransferase class V-fold PLP-dependent enzyme [Ekhidna lutea]SNS83546.1 dTDP-4-amino-4,6-dideoxygalactose transaminase [Ekhidna lutea]